ADLDRDLNHTAMDMLETRAFSIPLSPEGMAEHIALHSFGPCGFSCCHPVLETVSQSVESVFVGLQQAMFPEILVHRGAERILAEITREENAVAQWWRVCLHCGEGDADQGNAS